jgi:ABC-type antimicrobial peptide transport system permease subunit
MTRAACGVVLGVLLALVLARPMESFLFGIRVNDVSSFGVVSMVVLVVAMVASLIPAIRATRISPLAATRLD